MIQNGDKFTHVELFKSVDEVTSIDLKKYTKAPMWFSYDGNNIFDLREYTPQDYAQSIDSSYQIQSSARELDKQLKAKGYWTTYKFSHTYKMHPQMRNRILNDAYKLEYFYNVWNHPGLVATPENLEKIKKDTMDAARISYYYAQYLWASNPDTKFNNDKNWGMYSDWFHVLHFLIGTGYEFHPLDVQYHNKLFYADRECDQQEFEKQTKFKNWCKDEYGIDTGCLCLSDENMAKLTAILTKTDEPYSVQLVKAFLNNLLGRNL